MQRDITMQVHPTSTGYEITIPDLGGLTVSGATWTEAIVKASEAIDQARDAEAREILARRQQRKAANAHQTGKTVA